MSHIYILYQYLVFLCLLYKLLHMYRLPNSSQVCFKQDKHIHYLRVRPLLHIFRKLYNPHIFHLKYLLQIQHFFHIHTLSLLGRQFYLIQYYSYPIHNSISIYLLLYRLCIRIYCQQPKLCLLYCIVFCKMQQLYWHQFYQKLATKLNHLLHHMHMYPHLRLIQNL